MRGSSGRNGHFRNSTEICDYFVTPQEVLGFSWQIAKGMAYLSDMKVIYESWNYAQLFPRDTSLFADS